jgi:hypothetical protein
MKKRPLGITLIVVLYIILGILSLLWSGLVFGVGGLSATVGSIFGADTIATFGSSNVWSGTFGIVTAVIQIVVAIGLFTLKRWAWYLAIIAVGLTVIEGVIGIFGGGFFAFVCGGIGIFIPVIILIYLIRPQIRELFGIQTA